MIFFTNYSHFNFLKNLQKNKNQEDIRNLNSAYNRLMSTSQMGEIFKVLVISCF